MEKFRKKSFVAIIMGILSLVALCTILKVDTKMSLFGVVNEVSFPEYNREDVMNGIYQATVDEYYKNNFPLRPWFVRANNQLLYMLGANINDVIVVGKEGWFYTEEYLTTMITEVPDYNKIRYAEVVIMFCCSNIIVCDWNKEANKE